MDKFITEAQFSEALVQLSEEYISKCANAPITSDEDYLQAKENFDKGYTAEYADKDLNC